LLNIRFSVLLFGLLVLSTGCRQKTANSPLAPKEALTTFRLPEGFRIELVAAEPDVADPVAIAFDPQGRIYAVEMIDYPDDREPEGRIRLLEDRDGDGRFETSFVFADGFHFPTGVMPWKDGILVAAAPDIFYLIDTNGDHRADKRQVLLSGFNPFNPQLRVNGFLYGIDNWIYGAYPKYGPSRRNPEQFGKPGSPLHFPDHPEVPPVDIAQLGTDFRFRPDQLKIEPAAGNSQYGNTFNERQHRFGLWNNNHIRHMVIENKYLERNPYQSVSSAMQFPSDHENQSIVYPVTEHAIYIHESQVGMFTSACGNTAYTGENFPAPYDHSYFVCEPVHNLVHSDLLTPRGATYVAQRSVDKAEFLASTDGWFKPVFTTVGPDGALYVVDYYRKYVEHPDYVPEGMEGKFDLRAGAGQGRIYRVLHNSSKPVPKPRLKDASSAELVGQLSNPNLWWRTTAQRLLVERQDMSVMSQLESLAQQSAASQGRAHALWTLEGLGRLRADLVLAALEDPSPLIREQAIRLSEQLLMPLVKRERPPLDKGGLQGGLGRNNTLKSPIDRLPVQRGATSFSSNATSAKIRQKLLDMTGDPDDRVLFQLLCTLGTNVDEPAFAALTRITLAHIEDSWFQIAALSAAPVSGSHWFRAVERQPGFLSTPSKGKEDFLKRAASIVGARQDNREMATLLAAVNRPTGADWWRVATLAGLAQGMQRGNRRQAVLSPAAQATLSELLDASPKVGSAALDVIEQTTPSGLPRLQTVIQRSAAVARNEVTPLEVRVNAVRLLGLDRSNSSMTLLDQLLVPQQPTEIQSAAANSLLARGDPTAARILIDKWKDFPVPVSEAVWNAFLRNTEHLKLLLDAIEAGKLPPFSFNVARVNQLLRHSDDGVRKRAKTLFAEVASDRQKVISSYHDAASRRGDAARGKEVFRRVCSGCHRIGDMGSEVGPDLVNLGGRLTKGNLLTQILDPTASIAAGYEEYFIETADGRTINGILAEDSATSVTLRRKEGHQDTVLRSNIARMRTSTVSAMPEGHEREINSQQMSDLLEYLQNLGSATAPNTPK
jgi:putative membrane-bound dehydrogenase-like protein